MARAIEKRRETTWVFLVRFPTDEKLKAPWEKIVINRSGYARWCRKQHRNKATEVKKTFDAHESDKFSKHPLEPKITWTETTKNTNRPYGRHWENVALLFASQHTRQTRFSSIR